MMASNVRPRKDEIVAGWGMFRNFKFEIGLKCRLINSYNHCCAMVVCSNFKVPKRVDRYIANQ